MAKKKRRKKSNKGGKFEREIAKKLSLWWTNNENDNVLWRTQNSGGRATVRRKQGKETKGDEPDLKSTDPISKPLTDLLSIELKTGYKDAKLEDLFHHSMVRPPSDADVWWNWIKQAKRAHINGKTWSWALIVKKNARSPLIMLESVCTPVLFNGNAPAFKFHITGTHNIENSNMYVVFELDDFLACCEPKYLVKFAAKFAKDQENDRRIADRKLRKASKKKNKAKT